MGTFDSRGKSMAIIKNKKCMFFSMISIILVSSMIFFYMSNNKHSLVDEAEVIETRIMSIDSFISDIDHDIERGLYISSMRALIGMSEFMVENGSFFDNFDISFNEVLLNGSVDGNQLNITSESNLGEWMDKIVDLGDKLDLSIEFSNLYVQPYQDEPWNVKVEVSGRMILIDNRGLVSWNRSMNITSTISIIDFEDPLYTIITSGKYTNKIIKSNITDFVIGGDASNLIKHANNSMYLASDIAPSFLMRFSGNLSSSDYGIESIINVDELKFAAPDVYIADSSSIDYIYFGNSSVGNCKVNETKTDLDWFRLDNGHLNKYEAHCES